MSFTIYGGITQNNIDINDMVDNNDDIIWESPNKQYFARLSQTRSQHQDQIYPAIAIFSYDDIYEPIYAKLLDGNFTDYHDGYTYTDKFDKNLTLCFQEAQQFGIDVGCNTKPRKVPDVTDDEPNNTHDNDMSY